MRGLALALATACFLAFPGFALGADHLMRVQELKLSTGGNTAVQWVELADLVADEPGPSPPYKIRSFDGNGVFIDEQDISSIFNGADDNQPFLVSNDPAHDAIQDAELTMDMPVDVGHVCFTRGLLHERIHCIAYGCPASPLSSEGVTQRGKTPSDAESLQLLSTSLYLASPTPKAANTTGTSAACPASSDGGGGGGGAGGGTGGGGSTADTASPTQTLSYRRTQDVDRMAVSIRLNEAAAVAVGGSVNVPGRARVVRFRTVRRNVGAGVRTAIRLRLPRAGLRAAKRYLRRRGRRLTARVKIDARDSANNLSTRRLSFRVRG